MSALPLPHQCPADATGMQARSSLASELSSRPIAEPVAHSPHHLLRIRACLSRAPVTGSCGVRQTPLQCAMGYSHAALFQAEA